MTQYYIMEQSKKRAMRSATGAVMKYDERTARTVARCLNNSHSKPHMSYYTVEIVPDFLEKVG